MQFPWLRLALGSVAVFGSCFAAPVCADDVPFVFKTPRPEWMGEHSRFAVVDKAGKLLFRGDPRYELAGDGDFRHGFLSVRVGAKVGLLDAGGKVVLEPRYSQVYVIPPEGGADADAFAKVYLDAQTATCVDRSGKELIPAKDKHYIDCPRDGLARVLGPVDSQGKKARRPMGLVDRRGEPVIAMGRFEELGEFIAGKAQAMQGGKWGYIDSTGKVVVPLEFEAIQAGGFTFDRTAAKRGGKWGYLDPSGKFAIPPIYEEAKPFLEGLAIVKAAGKFGLIDPAGRVVVPIRYAAVRHTAGIIVAGRQLFDTQGREIPAPALAKYSWREVDPSGVIVFGDIVNDDRFGLADGRGTVLAEPAFLKFDKEWNLGLFRDGMLRVLRPAQFGPFAWRMDYGLLSTSGQFVPVPELGGLFGPYPDSTKSNGLLAAIGAVPGGAAAVMFAFSSWYGVALGSIVFPLLFGVWWVSTWRCGMRHVARVEVGYRRGWGVMGVWILLAAAWGAAYLYALKAFGWNADASGGDWAYGLVFFALLPLLSGIVIVGTCVWKPGKPLRSVLTGLLAFAVFALLSAAPFVLIAMDVDWHERFWPLGVFAALFGLWFALRKRAPLWAGSLRELAFAGLAAWGVVLLWMQAASLYGTFI